MFTFTLPLYLVFAFFCVFFLVDQYYFSQVRRMCVNVYSIPVPIVLCFITLFVVY